MEERFDERKAEIIKAAVKVISEKGFHKLTFRQIAAEAGISPGTLYYYYNSKNLILYDIIDYSQSEAVKIAQEMQTTEWNREDIYARLMKMLKNQILGTNATKIFLHLLHESLAGDEELAERIKEKYSSWMDSFETIIELFFDSPRGPVSRTVAILMEAVVDGMTIMEIMDIESIQNPNVEQFFELFFDGQFNNIMRKIQEIMSNDSGQSDRDQGADKGKEESGRLEKVRREE